MTGAGGMFITIDGPDGTGKTTVAKALLPKLEALGLPCVFTAEPTDTALGRHIRTLLREGAAAGEMTALFVRDRAEHIRDFILPQTGAGRTVICDRYKYSTVCYQHLQGEPLETLLELNSAFLSPDLAVILTAERSQVLLDRIGRRGAERDLFENRAVLERAIALYRDMERFYPAERFLYLDALRPVEETVAAIEKAVMELPDARGKCL